MQIDLGAAVNAEEGRIPSEAGRIPPGKPLAFPSTTQNIAFLSLWLRNPADYNGVPIVKVSFRFPCEWTVLNLDDLKNLLRLWIQGEERKYPQSEGFKGRELLRAEILKVFDEV